MAQASKRKKYLRRLKRERTLAYRMLGHVLGERDQYRRALEAAVKKQLRPDLDKPMHDPEAAE